MTRTFVWLSYPLDAGGPLPPGIPSPAVEQFRTVEKDGAAVYMISLANHSGTHVDAPSHVYNGGAHIADYEPNELVFRRPVIIDLSLADGEIVLPEHLEPHAHKLIGADIALLRFGRRAIRLTDPVRFAERSPGLSLQAGRWLRECCPTLRAMGVDLPSVVCIPLAQETERVHHELLGGDGGRFLIVEDMNLEHDLSGLTEVRLCPWMIIGVDSSPCSVIGKVR